MNMRPFKNRAETFIGLFILVVLGVLSAYLAVFLAFLGVCTYLYLEYEANNLTFHVEVFKTGVSSTSTWLHTTMSSFVRNLQQRSGIMSEEPKSEVHSISPADSPVTSRLRRVSIASSGSRYEKNRSDFNVSRSISSPTRYRLSPANRSVLDVYNRSDSRSPQKQTYNENMGYAYKSSPWTRNTHSPTSEKTIPHSNTSVRTVQTVGGPLLASSRANTSKTFDLRLYADANSPGLANRSVYYSQMGGYIAGRAADENRRPLSPLVATHQPQYGTVGQFPLVRLSQKGTSTAALPVLTAAVSPKAPRAHSLSSMNLMSTLVESPPLLAPATPVNVNAHSTPTSRTASPGLSGADRSDPHDISAKSVIEALKEISRKRIRSQCLTPNEVPDDESAKRQRRNASVDSVYVEDSEPMENSVGSVSPSTYQPKRGRSDSFNSSSDGSDRGSAVQGSVSETASSTPIARSRVKRLCSNEILSSLSSSRCLLALAASNKRKFTISPDGSPRSGTPVPVQTGKHFKSGSVPDGEEENGQEGDTTIQETPVRRRAMARVEEATESSPASPPPAQTSPTTQDTSVTATDSEDSTPEHWKRPTAALRDSALPHQTTPHPARKVVGTRDLAEQRRADRSALVGLLTVIGKGESPFRENKQQQPVVASTSSLPSSQQQKHVSFADSVKPGELVHADTVPVRESQQAPCVGTPVSSSASPQQGGLTGTTNTPPTVSHSTLKARAFSLQSSPTGSVMSSSAAPSATSPSPFTVSAGPQPQPTSSAAPKQMFSISPAATTTTSLSASGFNSPFTTQAVSTSAPLAAAPVPSAVTTAVASPTGFSTFGSKSQQVTFTSDVTGVPTGALVTPQKAIQDASSKPQVHMSTATSTAFSFGSPKMATVATVCATPATNTSTVMPSGGFVLQQMPATQTVQFGSPPKPPVVTQSVAPTSSSTVAGGFQFGAKSVTSAVVTTSAGGFHFTFPSSTNVSTSATTKPTFQFGPSAPSAAAATKPGGFNFVPGAADKIGTQAATSGPGATASQPSIFSSSAAYSKPAVTSAGNTLFSAAPASQAQASVTSPTSVPAFGPIPQKGVFGATASRAQAPTAGTTVTQQSMFGGTAPPVFGSSTVSSTQAPAFGTPSVSASQAPAFSSAAATTQPLVFGTSVFATTTQSQAHAASGIGNVTQAPTFGSGTGNQAAAFGSGTANQAPSFASGTTAQTPTFGGSGTTGQTPFGSGATAQTPAFGVPGTTAQTPAFGSGTTAATPAFGSGATSQTPAFRSSNMNQATPAFGSGSTSQAPAFGSGTTNQASAFGSSSPSQPVVFGSGATNQTPVFGTGSSSQAAVFGSGSSAQAPAVGAGSSSQVPAFGSGSSSQVPAFRAAATSQTPAFESTSGQSAAFGSTAGQAPSFGSGSSGSTPAFGSANQTSVFGSGTAPSFGGASSTPATTKSSVFGSTTPAFVSSGASQTPFGAAPPFGSSLGTTPAFGSTSTTQTPAFGSPFASSGTSSQASTAATTASQPPAVFAFGPTSAASGAATTTVAAAAPFQFGATGQSSSAATPKPGGFQFGQPANPSPAPFPFGAPAVQAAVPKAPFQFNAATPTPGGSMPNVFSPGASGTVGMFSIGSGSTAPRSRTTRLRNKNR